MKKIFILTVATIRSTLFFIFLAPFILLIFLFRFFPFSKKNTERFLMGAVHIALLMNRLICGVNVKFRGSLPKERCIIASKHQSSLEVLVFFVKFNAPIFIMRESILDLPIFGVLIKKMSMITVSKKSLFASAKTIKYETPKLATKEKNKFLVIFPEGQRVPIGEISKYSGGIYDIAKVTNLPIVPVAVTTGLLWPKNSFFRYSGNAIIEFMDPIISVGNSKKNFISNLSRIIEEKTDQLLKEEYVNYERALHVAPLCSRKNQ